MKELIKTLDSGPFEDVVKLQGFLNYFESKEEFLESENDLEKRTYFSTKIYPKEKARIGEVGWKVIFNTNPRTLSFEQNKAIFYLFLKQAPKFLNDWKSNTLPDFYGLKPQEGDILISKPWNDRIIPTNSHLLSKKRAHINTKFGFGDLDEYGYQYGRYDKDLTLRPI
jgi:hypothetical protein